LHGLAQAGLAAAMGTTADSRGSGGLQDGSRHETGADVACLAREGVTGGIQHVDEGAYPRHFHRVAMMINAAAMYSFAPVFREDALKRFKNRKIRSFTVGFASPEGCRCVNRSARGYSMATSPFFAGGEISGCLWSAYTHLNGKIWKPEKQFNLLI
jgi:hypothetical protein